jgi:hypothetical protein
MEQQDSGYDRLGHSVRGGPSHRLRMKNDCETIRHGSGTYSASGRIASAPTPAHCRVRRNALNDRGEAIPAAPLRPLHAYLSGLKRDEGYKVVDPGRFDLPTGNYNA